MSEDHLAASVLSFGDSNAIPPTPKEKPKYTTYPSPAFISRPFPSPLAESGDLPTRFAEEYSVFKTTTIGDLRGTRGSFSDFHSLFPESFLGHKRVSSTEGLGEFAAQLNHLPPASSISDHTIALAHEQSFSPGNSCVQHGNQAPRRKSLSSPRLVETSKVSKKARRGTITKFGAEQTTSPQITLRAQERKLAPKPTMQDNDELRTSAFDDSQQHDMVTFMGHIGDLLGYPQSAPAEGQLNFWDSSLAMGLDFGQTEQTLLPATASSSHRHTGSYDWNSEIQLFPSLSHAPFSNQENIEPAVHDGRVASNESKSDAACIGTEALSTQTEFSHTMCDPFGITNTGDAVDPGLLSRPTSATMEPDHFGSDPFGAAENAILESDKARGYGHHAPSNVKRAKRKSKDPDRLDTSFASKRPKIGRSVSDSRARKSTRGGLLPPLAPSTKLASRGAAGDSTGRTPGRALPFKPQHRLSDLIAIPETAPRFHSSTSIRLTIDAQGRAYTETTFLRGPSLVARSQSSMDLPRKREWHSPTADDSEDTDDEPIEIPSRHTSFTASFALPDPCKPVGSIFHSLRRIPGDRSNDSSVNGGDSDLEIVLNEKPEMDGDAASELQKLVENRHKRSLFLGTLKKHRSFAKNPHNFPGGIISPTSLTGSSYGQDSCGVRCVCNSSHADETDDFMVQCESCEMWLHGRCINITQRTMPSVFVCGFCANTPNATRRRIREIERENALGIATVISPLANKSFRSFR